MALFRLKVRWRPYRCAVCGHEHRVQTNHTGQCLAHCPGCSWKGMHALGRFWRADVHKERPHTFAGDGVGLDEVNLYGGTSPAFWTVRGAFLANVAAV